MNFYKYIFTEEATDFKIDLKKKDEHPQIVYNHLHNGYEIYFLVSGKNKYFIGDRILPIRGGDIVCIGPNVMHRTVNLENAHERFYIYFSFNFIKPLLAVFQNTNLLSVFGKQSGILHPEKKMKNRLRILFYKIFIEYSKTDMFCSDYLKLLLGELLYILSREKITEIDNYLHPIHEKIAEIIKYISNHYHERISLRQMAEGSFISPFYLSRLFKRETGFSLNIYINMIRINKALLLLKVKKYNISRIALETGFESISHFDRTFKKITGLSPGKWKIYNL
ncbi:MAG: hypothetical protein A2096_08430 [Spirochaetes bacterium GWF1_41_5]|nr:MAG: hypothetical protein A2096_08430 [Spirochaetes bacterium GWF1_41_5]HBE02585.1 hypothetical protein [Spirochaetia bacterium]